MKNNRKILSNFIKPVGLGLAAILASCSSTSKLPEGVISSAPAPRTEVVQNNYSPTKESANAASFELTDDTPVPLEFLYDESKVDSFYQAKFPNYTVQEGSDIAYIYPTGESDSSYNVDVLASVWARDNISSTDAIKAKARAENKLETFDPFECDSCDNEPAVVYVNDRSTKFNPEPISEKSKSFYISLGGETRFDKSNTDFAATIGAGIYLTDNFALGLNFSSPDLKSLSSRRDDNSSNDIGYTTSLSPTSGFNESYDSEGYKKYVTPFTNEVSTLEHINFASDLEAKVNLGPISLSGLVGYANSSVSANSHFKEDKGEIYYLTTGDFAGYENKTPVDANVGSDSKNIDYLRLGGKLGVNLGKFNVSVGGGVMSPLTESVNLSTPKLGTVFDAATTTFTPDKKYFGNATISYDITR